MTKKVLTFRATVFFAIFYTGLAVLFTIGAPQLQNTVSWFWILLIFIYAVAFYWVWVAFKKFRTKRNAKT